MCCWPFSDVYLEDDPLQPPTRRRTIITTTASKAARRQRYHHRSSRAMYQYEWTGEQWMLRPVTHAGVPMAGVPIAATTSPLVPIATQAGVAYVQQHPQQHPAVAYAVGGGGMGGSGGPPMVMMPGMGMPGPGGNYAVGGMCGMGGMGGMGSIHPEPALGVGQTPNEVMQEQLEFAYNNNMYEPQDFKPADDDKSRFYWVREMDGNWTQRSRATIDHIGCRWYITDSGVFYAVRLPN